MASYHAITAVGEAIIGLLKDARPAEFETLQFALYQPADFQNPMAEGVSLYLYRVAINMSRRNQTPRIDPNRRTARPPLPLDLHYLLIPWARTAEKQQRILGWSMRVLEDTPILSSGYLNNFGPEPTTFFADETAELICEPLSFQEIVNIWDVFKPNLQISVSYVVRRIAIDSLIEATDAPLVQTRVFAVEQGAGQ